MMTIQEKGSNHRRVHHVVESMYEHEGGWVKREDNRTIFYPSTHWEPVEEWVRIEVRKEDWEGVPTGYLAIVTSVTGFRKIKWRYSQ